MVVLVGITNVSLPASLDDVSGHRRRDVDATLEAFSGLSVAAFAQVLDRQLPVLGPVLAPLLFGLRLGREVAAVEDQDRLHVEVKQHVNVLHDVRYVAVGELILQRFRPSLGKGGRGLTWFIVHGGPKGGVFCNTFK